jgi:hypothetical protein
MIPPRPWDNNIVGWFLGIGPGCAKTGNSGINQFRVYPGQHFVAQPQLFHGSRAEILHQDIEVGNQLLHDFPAFLTF